MNAERRSGFLHRWSRRKIDAREGRLPDNEPAPAIEAEAPPALDESPVAAPPEQTAEQTAEPAPPTMDDVLRLTPESDFSRFVSRGVAPDVKNAALKKLFSDPHYNVMDGLDTYIDDYSQLAPLPESALRKMAASKVFGFFEDEARSAAAALADGERLHPASGGGDTPHARDAVDAGAVDAGAADAPSLPAPADSSAAQPATAEPAPTARSKP
ncbi:DUF3306 domain-containing protein [Achromobacter denitrificans]